MVVFTCNHCGESLQKPKVEKHYSMVCRKNKSVTCVDCFKDFKDEEFVAHTKCITEEERYAAKGSLPNGVVKKGEVKQESWTEMIKSLSDNAVATNVHIGQKKVLEIIVNSTNVPRKKIKFINFVKSSSGGRAKPNDIEAVWDMIEKYKAEQKTNKVTEEGAKPENGQTSTDDPPKKTDKKRKSDVTETENIGENVENPKKKKKSKKVPKDVENNSETKEEIVKTSTDEKSKNIETMIENSCNGNAEDSGKKKKKSKQLQEQNVDRKGESLAATGDHDGTVNSTVDVNETSEDIDANNINGSIKKPKKKILKVVPQMGETIGKEVEEEKLENNVNKEKNTNSKQKKRKSKNPEQAEVKEKGIVKKSESKRNKLENDETMETAAQETPKPKKRKSKSAADVAEIDHKETTSVENKKADTNGEMNDSKEFSFEDKILEIVKTKNISLKKLEKKVLGAYCKQTNVELSPKLTKKFNKKLKKLGQLEISEDTVKLRT